MWSVGRVVDLSNPAQTLPEFVIVDSNLIVAYFLRGLHQPFSQTVDRSDHLFKMLDGVTSIGFVTATCLNEVLHFAIKTKYREEIASNLALLRQNVPTRTRFDWMDLYKQNPGILSALRGDLQKLCRTMVANNLLIVQPADIAEGTISGNHQDLLVETMCQYGLDSNDASMLLDARRIGVMNVVSLDADLQRAATDFDIYTWLT
jgi:predicted nucleic acid-binding protein